MGEHKFSPAYNEWDELWQAFFSKLPDKTLGEVTKGIKPFVAKLAQLMAKMSDLEVGLALTVMARPFLTALREDAFIFQVMTGGNPNTNPFAEFLH